MLSIFCATSIRPNRSIFIQDRGINDDESQMGDEPHQNQGVIDPQAVIKASIKIMESMDNETRARWEEVNLRCLTLCIGTLERVNGVSSWSLASPALGRYTN